MYFDGSAGTRVATSSSTSPALFNMGTGDYTVECWLRTIGTPGSQMTIWDFRGPTDVTGQGVALVLTTSSTIFVYYNASARITSAAIAADTWTHLAVVRASGVYTLYVNGVSAGTYSNSDAVVPPANRPYIGAVGDGSQVLNGYISDFRVVKGQAIYTSNFSVPAAPLTAIQNTQLLTLQNSQPHNNHTFRDSSTYNHLITRNGNATQGTFSPFSPAGWSVYFNGSSGLTFPNNAAYGVAANADFCWEAFIYMTALPATNGH
ncbi:MAG: LamG domain-containing protein, partial [Verrucomicrobia bacterium]|nr:LamG domain-containing protein [Verrucomicrobiota bacterium]